MIRRAISCLTLLLFSSCHSAPQAIVVGEDHCGHCLMQIEDARFGGEVITAKGRVLKFDSVSCLMGFLAEKGEKNSQVLVSDFLRPGRLIPAETAFFLRSAGLRSPMGPGIAATDDESGLRKLQATMKGDLLRWAALTQSP